MRKNLIGLIEKKYASIFEAKKNELKNFFIVKGYCDDDISFKINFIFFEEFKTGEAIIIAKTIHNTEKNIQVNFEYKINAQKTKNENQEIVEAIYADENDYLKKENEYLKKEIAHLRHKN